MTFEFQINEGYFFVLFSAYLGYIAVLWGVAQALKIARHS